MQEVAQVFDTYRQDFEDTAEALRHQSLALQAATRQFAERSQNALQNADVVTARSPAGEDVTPVRPVVQAMSWAAVLIMASEVMSIFGAFILRPIIGLFFGKFGAGLCAYLGFPLYGLYSVYKSETSGVSDASVRFDLLSLSMAQSLLSGFVLSSRFVSAQPLAAAAPMVVGMVVPWFSAKFAGNRESMVIACGATALLANLGIGFVAGYLTTSFVWMSLMYTAVTALFLQFLLQRVHRAYDRVHIYQLGLATAFLLAKAVFLYSFGYTTSYINRHREYYAE